MQNTIKSVSVEASTSKILNVFQRAATRMGIHRQPKAESASLPTRASTHRVKTTAEASLKRGVITRMETPDLIKTVILRAKDATPEHGVASAELVSRGFAVDVVELSDVTSKSGKAEFYQVSLGRNGFETLAHSDRSQYMSAGLKISAQETSSEKQITAPTGATFIEGQSSSYPETPVDAASEIELTFPAQPPEPRKWQQFQAFSASQVRELELNTAAKFTGQADRYELFEAWASMWSSSWRYESAGSPSKQDLSSFREKFKISLGHCNSLGPYYPIPNDPAPASSSLDMPGVAFLTMCETARLGLKDKMREQWQGRNIRAELKRAYRGASSAERFALMAEYGIALKAFPQEFI